MKSVIVGTAGHIDHGKTALVKALTGIDADRLKEEKRRGITIDIGFAHLELPGPNGESLRLGFVDVPGHERFVRNMLAGIGGIDLVMLVIAADESIKPQTREHFDILRMLSVQRGITVLTKADLVDDETLEVLQLEVKEFLSGSFLDTSPIIPVSSLTGVGLDDLKKALAKMAADSPAKDSAALMRLPIDRVFTMKGFGTVVTGTLISGAVQKEDQLEVLPQGKKVRVRGIQVHGESANEARAGERTALNIAGLPKEELERGMVLATSGVFAPASRVDVSLSLLPTSKPLKDRARVHFHAYTSEMIATVVLHEAKQIEPGQTGFAQLRFVQPASLLPQDRFILRQFSPVITIGGGIVLDISPLRKEPSVQLSSLKTFSSGEPINILGMRISRQKLNGLSLSQAIAETGWRRETLEEYAKKLLSSGRSSRVGDLFIGSAEFQQLKSQIIAVIREFHKSAPLTGGISKDALREQLDLTNEVFTFAIDTLLKQKAIQIAGDLVHLPGEGVKMKGEEEESSAIIEKAFASAGLKVPALQEVLLSLKVDKTRAQKLVTLLLRDKVLIKISDDLVFHRDALNELRKMMVAEKAKSPKIEVVRFKEMTGVSRKYAIPLLEYLDRQQITRRVGNERQIL
ncbi:MAG: selenocysteine-specific translation elongation factor [Terriglobales bacterium]